MSIEKNNNGGQVWVLPPSHPVPQLQKPFEESMVESTSDELVGDIPSDAMTRRTMLLEAPRYERVIVGRWKQKPGENYHPLWKLVAQLTFGMHLLSQNMAISEEEVMRILQSHVDDIDAFLERTTEDFDLAQSDIQERIRCLKLPLAHGDVFDRMLEDRSFRASILDGNEKIDHVVGRTKKATRDALKDVQKGFDATNVMEKYLTKLSSTWRRMAPEHEAVQVAMLGNVEGWRRAFLELHLQGNKVTGSLKKLTEVVSEMQHRAAAVSRNLVAKAQRTKHITSQNAGHASSQLGLVVEHKPLPTEPGPRHSTRNSSRSTQMTSFSSRPDSGQKSSQGVTSQSQSLGPQSPQSSDSRKAVRPYNAGRSLSPDSAGLEGGYYMDRMLSIGGLLIHSGEEHPIELPADVPEDALRKAPVSVKNRLSLTLGLRSKETASHRTSSVYYPQALSNLLKTPGMSSLLLTTQNGVSKGTPVHAMMSPIMSDGEAAHFLSHGQSPPIESVNADDKSWPNSTKSFPTAIRTSARASIAETPRVVTRSSIRSSAFTSHTSVMAMAAPPVELPIQIHTSAEQMTQIERPSSSSSKKDSQLSSLGEPGPELAEGETTKSASVSEPRILIDNSVVTVAVVPASAKDEKYALVQPKAGQKMQTQVHDLSITTAAGDPPQEEVAADCSQSQEMAASHLKLRDVKDVQSEQKSQDSSAAVARSEFQKHPPVSSHETEINSSGGPVMAVPPNPELMAELEACMPEPLKIQPKEASKLVELEAPHHTFKLPPRRTSLPKNPEKRVSRASIKQLDDIFKVPTKLAIKPGMKPKDLTNPSAPGAVRPLKLRLARRDGKMVPIEVSSPGVSSSGQNLEVDVVGDIIERLSYTPSGSPIHTRSSSSASSNSAQRWSHRSSRSLGPFAQAPPPPAPGGRVMVDPDFSIAGQFEGERKQRTKKKKDSTSSTGSKSGWKTFFRTSDAHNSVAVMPESSEAPTITTTTTAATSTSTSGAKPGRFSTASADMLTTAGKDVLWFKGETKKALSITLT